MPSPANTTGESAWERQMRKVWTTRGARLEAARRLDRAGRASRRVVTAISLVLLALTVVLFAPGAVFDAADRNLVELVAVIGSVSLLVVSSLESGKAYELRSDRHHRAALALIRLYDTQKASGTPDAQLLVKEYLTILEQYPDNHEPMDYLMFAACNPKDFEMEWGARAQAKVVWHFASQAPWLAAGMVAVPFVILVVI